MDLSEYQKLALQTSKYGKQEEPDSAGRPLLGLSSKSGAVLDVYKKYILDRIHLSVATELLQEELGDLLWYVAVAASTFKLDLNDIADDNLKRVRNRYGQPNEQTMFDAPLSDFDSEFSLCERFPRRLVINFSQHIANKQDTAKLTLVDAAPNAFKNGPIDKRGSKKQGFTVGGPIGNELTDNSRRADGYRYHDAVHMGFMTVLGWSPIMRAMLRIKRYSNTDVDRDQDGARAIFLEEGLVAVLAQLAKRRSEFSEPRTIDGEVLSVVNAVVSDLEVKSLPEWLWRDAICQGFTAMEQLRENQGGYLIADLDKRNLEYTNNYP